jgi:hypothetical protein
MLRFHDLSVHRRRAVIGCQLDKTNINALVSGGSDHKPYRRELKSPGVHTERVDRITCLDYKLSHLIGSPMMLSRTPALKRGLRS